MKTKQFLSFLCAMMLCAVATVGCSEDDDPLIETFTVTFDSQGGSAVAAQTVAEGEKVTEPAAPTKEGVIFGGWYQEAACTNPWDFETFTVTEDITLYARWAARTFTITFQTNGGNAIDPKEVAEGGLLASMPIPTKSGSAFDGWFTDQALTQAFDATKPITGDMTLYAKWSEVTRAKLQELLEEAYSFRSSDYTDESYEKLNTAISNADNVFQNSSATQEAIVDAYQKLSEAINALVALPVRKTVALSIYPTPVNGFVYINPASYHTPDYTGEFALSAYGIDSNGEESTNAKTIFEYNGLEKWAMERTPDTPGPDGSTEKITVGDNYISFIPQTDLSANAEISITIKSADDTQISQTVTLKVISSADAKTMFLDAIKALPPSSDITLDNFEEIETQIEMINSLYSAISDDEKDSEEISSAYERLYDEYQNKLWDYSKEPYSFNGNICIIDGEEYEYAANGNFPAGTYTSQWDEDTWEGTTWYWRDRIILNADGTFYSESIENTTKKEEWVKEYEGEYKHTGNQTNGGFFYLHVTQEYDYDDYTTRASSTGKSRLSQRLNKSIKMQRR